MDINEKIKTMVMAQQKMIDAVAKIDPKLEIYPGWCISEVIAHLIGWDELAIALVTELNQKGKNERIMIDTIDLYNRQSVKKRKALSLKEIINQYVSVRLSLLGLLQKTPIKTLAMDADLPWGDEGSVLQVLDIWIDHEAEHLDELIERLAKGNEL